MPKIPNFEAKTKKNRQKIKFWQTCLENWNLGFEVCLEFRI